MEILTLEDFLPTAKDLETIHKRVFSGGEIGIQIHESLFIEPNAGRCSLLPARSWPGYAVARFGITDADANESHGGGNQNARQRAAPPP